MGLKNPFLENFVQNMAPKIIASKIIASYHRKAQEFRTLRAFEFLSVIEQKYFYTDLENSVFIGH